MDIKFTAFLYSKYSNTCKNFFGLVENIPPEIKDSIKFTNLCIDNEKIRKNVLNSKLDIKNVPCILIVYNDGRAEKFEGVDAFKWGNEILFKIEQQKPKHISGIQPEMLNGTPTQQMYYDHPSGHPSQQMNGPHHSQQMNGPHPSQQMHGAHPSQQMNDSHPSQQMIDSHPSQQMIDSHPSQQMNGPPSQQMNGPPSHNIKNIKEQMDIAKNKNGNDEYEDEYEEEELPKQPRKKNKKLQQVPKLKEKTSVDELLSESENENENVSININNKEPQKSANTIKKESLMNTAMAMQKAREATDKNIKIPLNGDR
jgi:hypothetical protein